MAESAEPAIRYEVVIRSGNDLHARPASELVAAARGHACDISIIKEHRVANAKSALAVLSLAVKRGDSITLSAAGAGSRRAVDELAGLISRSA